MKRIFILFLLLLTAKFASSQAVLEENFDYTAGDSLGAHGWTSFSGGTSNVLSVVAPGLTYTGYTQSGIGNATGLTTSGQDAYVPFTASISTGAVYVSYMIKVTASQTAGDYCVALLPSTSTTNFTPRFFVRKDASTTNFAFGISKSTETASYTGFTYIPDSTYLIVLKYQFNTGTTTDDQISLFVFSNGVPSIEPATPTIGPNTGTAADLANIGRFALRQGSASNAATVIIDGIRAANSWNNAPLPVELSSFSAIASNGAVKLRWTTASELNNSGFTIERKSAESNDWVNAGYVKGLNKPYSYTFEDKNIVAGRYNYRLKQTDFNGNFEYHNLANIVETGNPTNFEMVQNFPNPFNPETKISYTLPVDGNVKLAVFDITGREVAVLQNGSVKAGAYTVNFNAANLASGVYFYTLEVNGSKSYKKTMKMTVIK